MGATLTARSPGMGGAAASRQALPPSLPRRKKRGKARRNRTQFKGVDRDPIDEIYFVAKAHQKRYAGVKEGDAAEYGYWSEEDRRGGSYRTLVHREAPIIDDDPERGGQVLALSHDVRRLNLRYYDERKEEWLDEWDSESSDQMNRVPHAIEIALELEDREGRTASYFTRIPVKR